MSHSTETWRWHVILKREEIKGMSLDQFTFTFLMMLSLPPKLSHRLSEICLLLTGRTLLAPA
ncbi:hypothetical protein, partial [Salmonella enterica]|uniref:hypothetical protein n=1 Tax=Salmonella enterica TaxID=28901 RepID=UPI001FACBAFD